MVRAGVVLRNDLIIYEFAELMGHGTNNIAEYLAIEAVLDFMLREEVSGPIELFSDSMLVIRQLNGLWAVNGHLIPLCQRIQQKRLKVQPCKFSHVKREHPWIVEVDRMGKELLYEDRPPNI